MPSRRELRKAEEARLEALLAEEAKARDPGSCACCSRTLVHAAPGTSTPRVPTMKPFRGLPICFQCHQQIHRLHKNRDLARQLHTVEALRADPQFQAYLQWAAKRPPETVYL